MSTVAFSYDILDRMVEAVEAVRDRLRRTTAALEQAGIPYAVAGGNAVASWVARVDRSAVRNTQDVDILLRRSDLEAAKAALGAAGFIYRHVKSIDMFLDGHGAKARDAVHVLFAGEKVRPDALEALPKIEESEVAPEAFRVVGFEGLVRMKLISFRRKDQVHLQDLIEVGLIDQTWTSRFSPELAARLQQILDTPEG